MWPLAVSLLQQLALIHNSCCCMRMAQLMPLPLTVSCFSKIQIGFTFLVLAHPGSPGKRIIKTGVCGVCVLLHTGEGERPTAVV